MERDQIKKAMNEMWAEGKKKFDYAIRRENFLEQENERLTRLLSMTQLQVPSEVVRGARKLKRSGHVGLHNISFHR